MIWQFINSRFTGIGVGPLRWTPIVTPLLFPHNHILRLPKSRFKFSLCWAEVEVPHALAPSSSSYRSIPSVSRALFQGPNVIRTISGLDIRRMEISAIKSSKHGWRGTDVFKYQLLLNFVQSRKVEMVGDFYESCFELECEVVG